jgi:hypothetical protein
MLQLLLLLVLTFCALFYPCVLSFVLIFWVFKAIACKRRHGIQNGTERLLQKVRNIHHAEPIVAKDVKDLHRIGSITNGPKEIRKESFRTVRIWEQCDSCTQGFAPTLEGVLVSRRDRSTFALS